MAYLVGPMVGLAGCGADNTSLTVQYTTGPYNLQLIAVVSMGPGANSYSANIAPIPNGSSFEFYGRETSAGGAIDETYIEKIKQCAVYESREGQATPNINPSDFVAGDVSSQSPCTSTASGYFARGFGTGRAYTDPLTSGSFRLLDESDGFVLVMFFNNSEGPAPGGSPTDAQKRCFQVCGRKVQNKQFYSARSQTFSDVLSCNLSSLHCYEF